MLRISRRDFLNGVALTVASGSPAQQLAAAPARYPPALTGLRGQHDGSFEVAHAFARAGVNFRTDDAPVDESYDLVVVGGSVAGLRGVVSPCRRNDVRIRADNCDDYGGCAGAASSTTTGLIVYYGGSQSLQSNAAVLARAAAISTNLSGFKPLRAIDVDFHAFFGREALCDAIRRLAYEGDSVRRRDRRP
jgi:spermidine dehydrogenase